MGAPTAKGSYIVCPHCQGRGVVRSVETLALFYLRRIQTGIIRKKVARVECRFPLEVAQLTVKVTVKGDKIKSIDIVNASGEDASYLTSAKSVIDETH